MADTRKALGTLDTDGAHPSHFCPASTAKVIPTWPDPSLSSRVRRGRGWPKNTETMVGETVTQAPLAPPAPPLHSSGRHPRVTGRTQMEEQGPLGTEELGAPALQRGARHPAPAARFQAGTWAGEFFPRHLLKRD